jgi:hypothetical protein
MLAELLSLLLEMQLLLVWLQMLHLLLGMLQVLLHTGGGRILCWNSETFHGG